MAENRSANANIITRNYLDSILIEERLIDSVLPSLDIEFWGETFATPIMTPAFSHLPAYQGRPKNGLVEYSLAAKNCQALNWCGMMENDAFAGILETGAKTVRIIKPYADRDKIVDQIAFSEKNGAFAVGIDIDHIFGHGEYDLVLGERMAPQSRSDLRALVEATTLPFVIKGVLSVQDAVKCAEIGVKAIVVSHHHGRLPYAIPPLMVLPKIAAALKGSGVKIVVDCSIDSGADAYKALALGAHAVSVGRAMWKTLEESGVHGVEQYIRNMNGELSFIMASTGFSRLSDLDSSALWIDGRPMIMA